MKQKVICRGYAADGSRVCSFAPVDFRLQRDEEAPADGMTVTLAETGLPALHRVELLADGVCLFDGLTDEQHERWTAGRRETELVCRSFEALLLDNKAVPGAVRCPSRTVMEHWQLRPLGLRALGGSGRVFPGEYTAVLGESVYAVLLGFARLYLGRDALWMPDETTVCFSPREARRCTLPAPVEVVFSRQPAERISEVMVQDTRSGGYGTVVENRPAKTDGVVRRRFLRSAVGDAAALIAAGEKAAFVWQVTVPGLWDVRPGDWVDVEEMPGDFSALQGARAEAVRLSGGNDGLFTRVTLEAQKEETPCGLQKN